MLIKKIIYFLKAYCSILNIVSAQYISLFFCFFCIFKLQKLRINFSQGHPERESVLQSRFLNCHVAASDKKILPL